MSAVRLRAYRDADLAVLGALRADPATHAALLGRVRPATAQAQRAWIARRLAEPHALFLVVAGEADEPLGFVQVVDVDRAARRGSFGIALVVSGRGRGLGRAALDALLERLRADGALDTLLLHVAADNAAARALYASAGFRELGTRVPRYRDEAGTWHDVVAMERAVGA